MWYRIGATRSITGGRKIEPGVRMADRLKDVSTQYRRLYRICIYKGKIKDSKIFGAMISTTSLAAGSEKGAIFSFFWLFDQKSHNS
jgi:hypothetical protein